MIADSIIYGNMIFNILIESYVGRNSYKVLIYILISYWIIIEKIIFKALMCTVLVDDRFLKGQKKILLRFSVSIL